jgi:hypothetical protein
VNPLAKAIALGSPRGFGIPAASLFTAALFISLPPLCQADDLLTMGVTLVRATNAGLTGAGIIVAQPEALQTAGTAQFEVNYATVGEPESLFSWISTNGATNSFPNSLGTESAHADSVGDDFYGPTTGVAPGVAHVDNYEADYFFASIVEAGVSISDSVVNQSFAFFDAPAQQPAINAYYDNYIANNGNIFCSAVNGLNNGVGPPGTAYNCIGVGAYGTGAVVADGPTSDNGRSKPDLVAPGTAISFTTPYVSGAAAVLLQAAKAGLGGSNKTDAGDARTVKALLLNGALKPFDWMHTATAPLDTRYGAGVLNLFYSCQQLAGGQHAYSSQNSVFSGGAHPPVSTPTIASPLGWDFETVPLNPVEDTVNHYVFNLSGNATLTATLVWEKHANASGINNLSLFLYNATNAAFQAESVSTVDNVQHLYLPSLAPGRYDLEVVKYASSSSETFALAWQFFTLSPPDLSIAADGTNAIITWPSSPALFALEQTASLTPPVSWTNVTAPEWITNGTVWVNITNYGGTAFFRLAQ